jgi:4-amino-4-deoxy-L-arabinose transferase-like glycosyltransferase
MEQKRKIIFLSLILLLAFGLRFYQLNETAVFLGDQGRDLLLIRESLLAGKIPLVSQPTSQGINAGPVYFYLIIPSLLLSRFQPFGPIWFFTFLGVITTFFLFKLGEKLWGLMPAFLTTLIYATSPLEIQRTRGFWNPVLLPFFSLGLLLALFQVQEKKKLSWFCLLGFLLGLAVQPHPTAFFLFLLIVVWWFFFFFKKTPAKARLNVFKWSLLGGLSFLLPLFPYVLYQLQHDLVDFKKIILIFFELFLVRGQSAFNLASFIQKGLQLLADQFSVLTSTHIFSINLLLGLFLFSFTLFASKKSSFFWPIFLSGWFFGGLILVTLYPWGTFAHYASFFWIVPFLFLGFTFKKLTSFLSTQKLTCLVILLVFFNFYHYFLFLKPTNDLAQTEKTTQVITQKTQGQAVALLLDSPRSPSDAHFRYFLTLTKVPLKETDDSEAKVLVFICDQPSCLVWENIQEKTFVDTQCLPECPTLDQQKKISLKEWRLIETETVLRQKLYFLQKNHQQT